jgi:hypothetical protein
MKRKSKSKEEDRMIIWYASETKCEMAPPEILRMKSIEHTPEKIIMEVERCDTGQVCKCIIKTNLKKK